LSSDATSADHPPVSIIFRYLLYLRPTVLLYHRHSCLQRILGIKPLSEEYSATHHHHHHHHHHHQKRISIKDMR